MELLYSAVVVELLLASNIPQAPPCLGSGRKQRHLHHWGQQQPLPLLASVPHICVQIPVSAPLIAGHFACVCAPPSALVLIPPFVELRGPFVRVPNLDV
jgi:hypothetical protein